MKRIPLSASCDGSRFALVDDEDYERVSQHAWSLSWDARRDCCYASAKIAGRTVYLHRFLLGLAPGDGLEADHRNRDTLDCRRENLRLATRKQNAQNRVATRGAVSRFRGVSRVRCRKLWRARYASVTVGYRRTELEAAMLIDDYRRVHVPFAEPDPALLDALAQEATAA